MSTRLSSGATPAATASVTVHKVLVHGTGGTESIAGTAGHKDRVLQLAVKRGGIGRGPRTAGVLARTHCVWEPNTVVLCDDTDKWILLEFHKPTTFQFENVVGVVRIPLRMILDAGGVQTFELPYIQPGTHKQRVVCSVSVSGEHLTNFNRPNLALLYTGIALKPELSITCYNVADGTSYDSWTSTEQICERIDDVMLDRWVGVDHRMVVGHLVLTPLRLLFFPWTIASGPADSDTSFDGVLQIPLGFIGVLAAKSARHGGRSCSSMQLMTKDLAEINFTLLGAATPLADAAREHAFNAAMHEIAFLIAENNAAFFFGGTTTVPRNATVSQRSIESKSDGVQTDVHDTKDGEVVTVTVVADAPGDGEAKGAESEPGSASDSSPTGHAAHAVDAPGWGLYDAFAEANRVSQGSSWAVFDNTNFQFSPTYPARVLAAPMEARDLQSAAHHRTKNRLPSMTWRHPQNGASLCRASQPRAGFRGAANDADIQLLEHIRDTVKPSSESYATRQLLIADARPRLNAISNHLRGGGAETPAHYRGSLPRTVMASPSPTGSLGEAGEIEMTDVSAASSDTPNQVTAPVKWAQLAFLDIENIHVMRNALRSVRAACTSINPGFWTQLEASHWLEHTRLILDGAMMIARRLNSGHSVLVHCSDGWDRTAQLSALSQLLIDPTCRTVHGFMMLIEKEWCSFGHKFEQRCSSVGVAMKAVWESLTQPSSARPTGFSVFEDSEWSPVFTQFLDCVWQLTEMWPTAFEFNELFLADVLRYSHSNWFGTFLYDTYKARMDAEVHLRTFSMWSFMAGNLYQYLNPMYRAPLLADTGSRALSVEMTVREVRLIPQLFAPSVALLSPVQWPCLRLWPVLGLGIMPTFCPVTQRIAGLTHSTAPHAEDLDLLTHKNLQLMADVAALRRQLVIQRAELELKAKLAAQQPHRACCCVIQ